MIRFFGYPSQLAQFCRRKHNLIEKLIFALEQKSQAALNGLK